MTDDDVVTQIQKDIAAAVRKPFSELSTHEVELLWRYTSGKTLDELKKLYPVE